MKENCMLFCQESVITYCNETRFKKNKVYQAEIVGDLLYVRAENNILVQVMDYENNEWFLIHFKRENLQLGIA